MINQYIFTMKINFLLPNKLKTIGWLLFIPSLIIGLCALLGFIEEPEFLKVKMFAIITDSFLGDNIGRNTFTLVKTNLFDELLSLGLIVGAVFIAFSKQKNEDEFIAKIRLESLLWATYVNYSILILTILFVYEFAFYWVMVLNMFTMLFFFLIRFYWVLIKTKKAVSSEK